MLNFYPVELKIGDQCLKDKPPPEGPSILGWSVKDAYTHNFKIPLSLELRVSESLIVPLRYRIRCTNLDQLSLLEDYTLVIRNTMAAQVSGLALYLV